MFLALALSRSKSGFNVAPCKSVLTYSHTHVSSTDSWSALRIHDKKADKGDQGVVAIGLGAAMATCGNQAYREHVSRLWVIYGGGWVGLNPLGYKYLDLNSPNLPWTKRMKKVGRIGS